MQVLFFHLIVPYSYSLALLTSRISNRRSFHGPQFTSRYSSYSHHEHDGTFTDYYDEEFGIGGGSLRATDNNNEHVKDDMYKGTIQSQHHHDSNEDESLSVYLDCLSQELDSVVSSRFHLDGIPADSSSVGVGYNDLSCYRHSTTEEEALLDDEFADAHAESTYDQTAEDYMYFRGDTDGLLSEADVTNKHLSAYEHQSSINGDSVHEESTMCPKEEPWNIIFDQVDKTKSSISRIKILLASTVGPFFSPGLSLAADTLTPGGESTKAVTSSNAAKAAASSGGASSTVTAGVTKVGSGPAAASSAAKVTASSGGTSSTGTATGATKMASSTGATKTTTAAVTKTAPIAAKVATTGATAATKTAATKAAASGGAVKVTASSTASKVAGGVVSKAVVASGATAAGTAAAAAAASSSVDPSNIFFNVYMTLSSMMSGLMKLTSNPSTIAAVIVISIMAFVYRKFETQEWRNFEDAMDDLNIRVPSQSPSLAYSYSPSYQMSEISQYTPQYTPQYVPSRLYEPYQSPYAAQSRQYDEPYRPPYILQSRERYYDGSSSRSSRQYRDRNYDYYDQPRVVTPPSAYPTGGRRFQEPSSRSVNPPSVLSELSAYSEQNTFYDRPALREPFNAPRPFSRRPSQPPQRMPVDAYNVPSRVSANRRPEKNSFLSGLMPRSRDPNPNYYEPNRNYQNNQKDNAIKQLSDGFASTTSQLFSGIPSMGSTYQPTSIPDSVMMPRRGARGPKPIITTTARTSLTPERSFMSELVNNPDLATAIADNPTMNGGYNTRRSQDNSFPSLSPYAGGSYGQSMQEEYQQPRRNNDRYNNYNEARDQQNNQFSFNDNSMRNNDVRSEGFDNRSKGNMMQSNSFLGYNGNNQGNVGPNNMNQGNSRSAQTSNNLNENSMYEGNSFENNKKNSGNGGLGRNLMSSIGNLFGIGNDGENSSPSFDQSSGSGNSFSTTSSNGAGAIGGTSGGGQASKGAASNSGFGKSSSGGFGSGLGGGGLGSKGASSFGKSSSGGFGTSSGIGGGQGSKGASSFGKSSGGFGGGLGGGGLGSKGASSFGKSSGGFGGGLGGGAATGGNSSFGTSSGGFGGGLGGGGLGSKGASSFGKSAGGLSGGLGGGAAPGGFGKSAGGFKSSSFGAGAGGGGMYKSS